MIRFTQGKSVFASIGLLVALSACNGAPDGAGTGQGSYRPDVTGGKTDPAPADPGNNDPGKPAAGCVTSDPDHLCIGIKAVVYRDSAGTLAVSEAEVGGMINRVNALWSQCNIGFQVESFDAVNPGDYGLSYGTQSQSETAAIRKTFNDGRTFLVGFTGAWDTNTIAWTELPGGAPYGAIISADFATNEVCVGHELGHYMGLDHTSSASNLLYPVVYSTARGLSASQCASARETNLSYWADMLRR